MDAEPEGPDDLDTLAVDVSRIARDVDYRPTRLRLIRERLLAWIADRDEDHADALSVAYSTGAAERRERTTGTQEGAPNE